MTLPNVTLNPAAASLADGTYAYVATRFGSPPNRIVAVHVPDGQWSIRLRLDDDVWVASAVRCLTADEEAFIVAESNDCAAAYFAALDWANAAPAGRVTVPVQSSCRQ